MVFLWSPAMILSFFSSEGWESWDVEHRPVIPEGMPVLVDDDLRFEDGPGAPRPTVAVNGWLRELPASGAPAPNTWEVYARAVKDWMEFLAQHGVGLFDSRGTVEAGVEPLRRTSGDRADQAPVRSHDLEPAHEHLVDVLPLGAGRGPRPSRAVHLPHGAGAVRRHRPRGASELGGAADAETACDDQLS